MSLEGPAALPHQWRIQGWDRRAWQRGECRPGRLSLLPYYQGPADVSASLGVPVSEGLSLRGVLVGDRKAGAGFSASEVELFTAAADRVMRIVQSERVFQAVERSKHEHERFYRASAALNRALTLAEVYDAAIEGARGACEFDFAAIATYTDGNHVLSRVVGEGADELAGRAFCDAGSIASMVVKNKLALPAAGDWHDRGGSYVFEPRERFKGFESLYVLPLLVKDEVMGTFTVAAQRVGAFPADRREMLGVIANQVAISLQNGHMVEALEEKATTDGLTGLTNHRTFQERFSAMLGRAERLQTRVSFLLTDIDHFKKINDTHGHPTGDQVLKRVAAILKASARKIDIVARYGGEEFALVLEGTDRTGARQLAERIRQEVGAQKHDSAKIAPMLTSIERRQRPGCAECQRADGPGTGAFLRFSTENRRERRSPTRLVRRESVGSVCVHVVYSLAADRGIATAWNGGATAESGWKIYVHASAARRSLASYRCARWCNPRPGGSGRPEVRKPISRIAISDGCGECGVPGARRERTPRCLASRWHGLPVGRSSHLCLYLRSPVQRRFWIRQHRHRSCPSSRC
jgi:diguanylate cyclase (GGDEF)-like protein